MQCQFKLYCPTELNINKEVQKTTNKETFITKVTFLGKDIGEKF